MDLTNAIWHRSNRCDTSACVEVALVDRTYCVRNSEKPKHVLYFTQGEWDAFVLGAKDGEFDVEA